jgi:hypothetical protein
MAVLGDFTMVSRGTGNYTSAFEEKFTTGKRLSSLEQWAYLLADITCKVDARGARAEIAFIVNGEKIATMPAIEGQALRIFSFAETYLSPSTALNENTLRVEATPGAAFFLGDVVCFFHQAAGEP